MRIIGINGVWCQDNPIWDVIGNAYRRRFPGAEFVVEEDSGCHPWEIARMRRFTDRIVEKHDAPKPIILVGHSMGGVIACAVAEKMQHASILGITTVFSPHMLLLGAFPRLLGAPARPKAPVVSFEARRDELILWGARHPYAIEHLVLDCDHYEDLVDNVRVADKIADASAKHFL